MPRGGYRAGAGRPKGAKSPKALALTKAPTDIKKAARKSKLNPLEYMLEVMNDEKADDARRDRMAVAAAPFVHVKPGDKPAGKKEAAAEAAQVAGSGTEWGDDLRGPQAGLN
jgi:hypothetical protein